jgi:beta-N-acetylhexosaminidase
MYYGPVWIDLEGSTLTAKEKELLKNQSVGGILLFTRNYTGLDSLKALIAEIRANAKNSLLIAVDHEGGRIWRFKEGFTKLPPAADYGKLYDKDSKAALNLAFNAGWVMASELLDCGIDLSLAPVLDLDKGISEVIGDRAFHQDVQVIAELAAAFIRGMNQVGMAATGKHFPGHGGIVTDSHLAEAIDPRPLQTLLAEDMVPFAKLSNQLAAIMPAHVIYPAVDSVPAGFSKRWLQEILRKELQFKGAVISDCLSMKGASMAGDFVLRARMALDAGCDMVILAQQDREQLQWVLDKLDRTTSSISNDRLKALAGQFQNESRRKSAKPTLVTS